MTEVLRDAVKTCRALSIPYLWIDALCIIQDDPLDWERESALVGKVYSSAYLTISALKSESCIKGFLDRQPPDIEIPFQSRVKPEICGSIGLYPYRAMSASVKSSELLGDFLDSKLTTRGWVFQEMAMSTRVLAFGKHKVHFIRPYEYQTQGQLMVDRRFLFQIAYLDRFGGNASDIYEMWRTVVVHFSPKLLTYKSDRFPALSGIAEYFSTALKDEYIAGLWKRELYRDLFWVCSYVNTKSWDVFLNELSDVSAYVAPSWSWASRGSSVGYGTQYPYVYSFHHFQREYRSIESRVVLKGSDPFGRLDGASLYITTKIRPLPSEMNAIEGEHGLRGVHIGPQEKPFAYANLDWFPGERKVPQRETVMVLLGSALTTEGDEDEEDKEDTRLAYGLLVHPAPGTDKFFRVGTFHSRPSDGWGFRSFEGYSETTVILI
ncbi:heterokaryon incompatibility protein-domain-containing protein [Hypoxylon sp. NC1633]|nr:heterokaryon incompatibility protein-domain-containing protein [Hypoxylon sp. NC1633]